MLTINEIITSIFLNAVRKFDAGGGDKIMDFLSGLIIIFLNLLNLFLKKALVH